MKRIILILVTVFGTLVLAGILGILVLSKSLCSTDTVNKYLSPSNRYAIRQTVQNCGATTDFVTSLDLGFLRGKIISIKGAHENDLYAQWIDNNNIVINYTGDPDKIYEYKTEISGIKIQYKSGEKNLEIKCTYYECEELSRQLEIQRRKRWCNFSSENRKTCDQKPGWETCNDDSWCHYDGPNR